MFKIISLLLSGYIFYVDLFFLLTGRHTVSGLGRRIQRLEPEVKDTVRSPKDRANDVRLLCSGQLGAQSWPERCVSTSRHKKYSQMASQDMIFHRKIHVPGLPMLASTYPLCSPYWARAGQGFGARITPILTRARPIREQRGPKSIFWTYFRDHTARSRARREYSRRRQAL